MTGQSHPEQSDSGRIQSLLPPDPAERRVFVGLTGIGREVDMREVNGWLDFRYIDAAGDVRGFSLNRKYTAELYAALAHVVIGRAMREAERAAASEPWPAEEEPLDEEDSRS